MKKPAVTSFLVAQKMMKKRIDKIEKLNLNFDPGSTDVLRPWSGRNGSWNPDKTEMKSRL